MGSQDRLLLEGLLGDLRGAELAIHASACRHMESMGSGSTARRRLMARLRMEGHNACLCRSSWVPSLERPGGEYEYIDVAPGPGGERLIVDIDFRAQFEVARATPAYRELQEALPRVFVGTEGKLDRVVTLLCSAAEESLRVRGLEVPPWRKAGRMQCKWLSCYVPAIALPRSSKVELGRGGMKGRATWGAAGFG